MLLLGIIAFSINWCMAWSIVRGHPGAMAFAMMVTATTGITFAFGIIVSTVMVKFGASVHAAANDALESNPDLAAFFAINDPSALGAYAALENAGKTDQVKIIGFDGEKAGKEAIRDGKIVCDPIQYPDQIGKKTIEMMRKYLAGEDIDQEMDNGQILIPSKLYYKEDADNDPSLK